MIFATKTPVFPQDLYNRKTMHWVDFPNQNSGEITSSRISSNQAKIFTAISSTYIRHNEYWQIKVDIVNTGYIWYF